MRTIISIALAAGTWTSSAAAQPVEAEAAPAVQEAEDATPSIDAGPTAIALARALDERLTVWQRNGRRVYVAHCRAARNGCRARIVAFARSIATVAIRVGVDPFLLAAMAGRESGFNPFAEGGIGERGLVQLHPRGVGSRVRFVRNEGYRRSCERRDGACQDEVLEAGARLVRAAIDRCGSVLEGLGAYNTGRCQETGYSRRVMSERQRLLVLAKGPVRVSGPALVD